MVPTSLGLLLSQVVSGAWDKPWLLQGGLTRLDALSTPSAKTQIWVQIMSIFMIMHPLLGERPPPREYDQSHELHSCQHTHTQLHLQSWSPCALAMQEAWGMGGIWDSSF